MSAVRIESVEGAPDDVVQELAAVLADALNGGAGVSFMSEMVVACLQLNLGVSNCL
jgi:hypothetical protein